MSTRVYTVIETDEAEKKSIHFEWYGGHLVNVVDEIPPGVDIDCFSFMEQPTLEEVIIACEGYFNG